MPLIDYDPPEGGCTCAACRSYNDQPGNWRECESCGEAYDYDREGSMYYCGVHEDDGSDDYDEDDDSSSGEFVHYYSYTPLLNFRRSEQGGDPDDGSLHLGIELEVPTDYPGELAESIYNGPGQRERLLYCKEDGSIDGVEIVSHPMTHKFFRESFPFEMFKAGSEQSGNIRDYDLDSTEYGIHVHVSRSGFKSESHALRWLLLIYGNQEHVETLARRKASNWTKFDDAHRCEEKASGRGYGDRYVAVNACNSETFEVRVFKSTWTEREFRAAVDFVHAAVVYTKGLSAMEALRGGLDWDRFMAWVDTREEYRSLSNEMRHRHGEDLLPEVQPEPVPVPEPRVVPDAANFRTPAEWEIELLAPSEGEIDTSMEVVIRARAAWRDTPGVLVYSPASGNWIYGHSLTNARASRRAFGDDGLYGQSYGNWVRDGMEMCSLLSAGELELQEIGEALRPISVS